MNNIILKKFVGRVERPHSYCKSKKKFFPILQIKKKIVMENVVIVQLSVGFAFVLFTLF